MGLLDLLGGGKEKKVGKELVYLNIGLSEGESTKELAGSLELSSIETERLMFGLQIVNSVIAIWIANIRINNKANLRTILDEMLDFHLEIIGENLEGLRLRDYVVYGPELKYIQGKYGTDWPKDLRTHHDTLFQMIYPYRSERYHTAQPEVFRRLFRYAETSNPEDAGALGPMSPLAKQFTMHFTGATEKDINIATVVGISLYLMNSFGAFSEILSR